MKLLLDTHALIWALEQPERLPGKIHRMVSDQRNRVSASLISVWEIAIKHGVPRRLRAMSVADVAQQAEDSGFDVIPIALPHVLAVESLPSIHLDPFDRLLVAQALVERLRLVTHDSTLGDYDPSIIVF